MGDLAPTPTPKEGGTGDELDSYPSSSSPIPSSEIGRDDSVNLNRGEGERNRMGP